MPKAIPGDPEFVRENVSDYLMELYLRLDGVLVELEGLPENADAIARVVTTLGLSGESSDLAEFARVTKCAEGLLEKATEISESVMKIAGVNLGEASEDDQDDQDDRDGTDKQSDTTQPSAAEDETAGGLGELSLPLELTRVDKKMVDMLFGQKIFGIGSDEYDKYEVRLSAKNPAVVHVLNEGKTLAVCDDDGVVVRRIDKLVETVTRGINVYIRLQVAGVTEFKRSDVEKLYGAKAGIVNMAKLVKDINSVMQQLGLPDILTSNGEPTAKRRYIPTGEVLFLAT